MVYSNIVEKESLRKIQLETMNVLKNALVKSFGPHGSNTIISKKNALPRYTKDGHTILSSLMLQGEIENCVRADIEEETRTQSIKVGDSTTSTTILSALIFEKLAEYEKENENLRTPASIVQKFKEITEEICDVIKENALPVTTTEMMYNIALIATNGNYSLASTLCDIYNDYGLDVYIDVKASMNGTTYLKEINGMVMDCGFLDPTLINDVDKNACVINNPKIYAFKDPIDTLEMGTFLDSILYKNIIQPTKEKKPENLVPTVIIAPKISRDYSSFMDQLMQIMASAPAANRGWLNIVTDIQHCDIEQFEDICDLCGCKYIKKYLDLDIQAEDIKNGLAPTPDTVDDFAGTAAQVVSDANKTSFIEPAKMYDNGKESALFNQRTDYLQKQIEKLEVEGNNTTDIYTLKKRLNSLKGKMVEIYVGGVSVADRDAERDLLEDAVLNCRSAALNGVGFAANFEGLRASKVVFEEHQKDGDYFDVDIARIIHASYREISKILYDTMNSVESSDEIITDSLNNGCPRNIVTAEYDDSVLTSIDTDICTLKTISKIITIMATANQFLLSDINVNRY